jgi:hypothetical protein
MEPRTFEERRRRTTYLFSWGKGMGGLAVPPLPTNETFVCHIGNSQENSIPFEVVSSGVANCRRLTTQAGVAFSSASLPCIALTPGTSNFA